MKISYEDHDQISLVTASGSLTIDESDSFRRSCEERMERGIKSMILDLSHLVSLDSMGIESLLWLSDRLGRDGGKLRLVNPDEQIRTILRITRLEGQFDIHDSVEAAGKSLR